MLTYSMIKTALDQYEREKSAISYLLSIFHEPAYIHDLRSFARDDKSELSANDYLLVTRIVFDNLAQDARASTPLLHRLKEILPKYVTTLQQNRALSLACISTVRQHKTTEKRQKCADTIADYFSKIPSECTKELNELSKYDKNLYQLHALTSLEKAKELSNSHWKMVCAHETPRSLALIFEALQNVELLCSETINATVAHPYLARLEDAVRILLRAKLPVNVYFADLLKSNGPNVLALAFVVLHVAGLPVTEYQQSLSLHECPFATASVLSTLDAAGALNPVTRANVLHRKYAEGVNLDLSFQALKRAKIDTKDNLLALLQHSDPYQVSKIFEILVIHGFYTPKLRAAILARTKIKPLLYSISLMEKEKFLSHDLLNLTLAHAEPDDLIYTLNIFKKAGLLNIDNRNRTVELTSIKPFTDIVVYLINAGQLLNQTNLNRLFENPGFVIALVNSPIRDNVPTDLLTQTHFDDLFALYMQTIDNPDQAVAAIRNYINNTILRINEPNQINTVNTHQSTHTASVHESASQSARRLKETYPNIEIEKCFLEIEIWLHTLDTSSSSNGPTALIPHQNAAAQRAISRLGESNSAYGNYVDRASDTSTAELLALIWHGIHDEQHRQGTLDDALLLLRDGLYECQREYNLDSQGKEADLNSADRPTCAAGTFNKLMEKMQGILPQVEIQMITKQTAALKLPIVVKEVLVAYLKDNENRDKLIDSIKTNGIEAVWSQIKPKIAEELFAEFGRLYQDISDPNFTAMIETGIYVPIDEEFLYRLKTTQTLSSSSSSLFYHSTAGSSSSNQHQHSAISKP